MTAFATQPDWPVPRSASEADDAKVDEALLEPFPASDAPSWTLGVSRVHTPEVIDVSRPPPRGGFWRTLLGSRPPRSCRCWSWRFWPWAS